MGFTTRTDFPKQLPVERRLYCWHCKQPGLVQAPGKGFRFQCNVCGKGADRAIIFDPIMAMGFDDKDRLFHVSSGVFIQRESDGKLLLFQRRKFPYLLTIPAGHIEVDEDPEHSARRECEEEVGYVPSTLTPLFTGVIEGDSCLGGADIHQWHAFLARAEPTSVTLDAEGSSWGWYSLDELNEKNTVQPVLMIARDEAVQRLLSR